MTLNKRGEKMLIFCKKCGNIMVLNRKMGRLGEYICRSCHTVRKIPIEKVEITEKVEFRAPSVVVSPSRRELGY